MPALDEAEDEDALRENAGSRSQRLRILPSSRPSNLWTGSLLFFVVLTSTVTFFLFALSLGLIDGLALDKGHIDSSPAPAISAEPLPSSSTTTDPDYFQTSVGFYAGPTTTAAIQPFLAQTNPAPFGTPASYVPNDPIYTALPILNAPNASNIFHLTGQLSPYFSGPGFGANEYPLPLGTNITHVNVLHRHGSRYPTEYSSVASFGRRIHDLTRKGTARWSGALAFINSWTYTLGSEILTQSGHKELFDSGVLHYYNYGALHNPTTKIVARTTTQDRMFQSAQYFMAGFFGLNFDRNVSIEAQIEQVGFNTSLAGYDQCPNSYSYQSAGGTNASRIWEAIYLADATARLNKLVDGYEWSVADSYHAQTLCPYETVAYGYSSWCDLFTYEEWEGFEYSIDLQFNGNDGFASPSGRGVGIGYVQEIYARLQNHLYSLPPGATNVNRTLDTMDSTFPTNQTLYFDFSHDTNIMSVITAFGLRQFADDLPATSMLVERSLVVSHLTPFAARMVWEVIHAPHPVKATRPSDGADVYNAGDAMTYVHLLIGQRTVPLHRSYPECEVRDDGWCDMQTFMAILNSTLNKARYEYSCFGNYSAVPYGDITDGAPITKRDMDTIFALGGQGSHM